MPATAAQHEEQRKDLLVTCRLCDVFVRKRSVPKIQDRRKIAAPTESAPLTLTPRTQAVR
jgi:hypothetical protein